MTSTDKYLKEFEDIYLGGPSEQEKLAFEKKLAANPEMQKAWKEYRSIMDGISDKEAVSFRLMLNKIYGEKFQSKRIHIISASIWFKLSAAAVIIVIVGCLLYYFCAQADREFAVSNEFIDTTVVVTEDSAILVEDHVNSLPEKENKEIPVEQIASIYDDEKYQINPAYAELLHNVYRSYWFNLIAPLDSVIFQTGDSITFSWESNIYEPLYFDVLDRRGKVIFKQRGQIESPWTYKPVLEPAIYMFRFSTKDQPVWMGVMVGV